MKKALKIIGIILAILITIGILGYSKSVGFTKKSKYTNCAETCEKIMFNKSNIPACKTECEKITGYNPASANPSKTKTLAPIIKEIHSNKDKPNPTDTPVTTTTGATTEPQSEAGSHNGTTTDYHCEWSWPQKIIIRDTKKVIFKCPSEKPWCDYADRKYENVGCCTDYDETTKAKSNCTPLSELLQK